MSERPTKAQVRDMMALAAKLVELKNEAGKLGLFQTMQKIDVATTTIGWEIAGKEAGGAVDE